MACVRNDEDRIGGASILFLVEGSEDPKTAARSLNLGYFCNLRLVGLRLCVLFRENAEVKSMVFFVGYFGLSGLSWRESSTRDSAMRSVDKTKQSVVAIYQSKVMMFRQLCYTQFVQTPRTWYDEKESNNEEKRETEKQDLRLGTHTRSVRSLTASE